MKPLLNDQVILTLYGLLFLTLLLSNIGCKYLYTIIPSMPLHSYHYYPSSSFLLLCGFSSLCSGEVLQTPKSLRVLQDRVNRGKLLILRSPILRRFFLHPIYTDHHTRHYHQTKHQKPPRSLSARTFLLVSEQSCSYVSVCCTPQASYFPQS